MKVLCALLAVVLSLDATLNKPGKELVVITNRTMSSAIFMEFSAPSYKNCFSSCLVVQRCTVFSFKPRENGSLCYLGDSISFNDSFPKFPGSVLGLFFVSGFWHGPDNYTYWSPRTMLSYLDAVDECKKNNMRLGIYKNLTSFKMLKAYAEIYDKIWVDMAYVKDPTGKAIWEDGTFWEQSEVQSIAQLNPIGLPILNEKWRFWFVKPGTFVTKKDEDNCPIYVLCQGISLMNLVTV